jgi:DNA-directed RNA polymerase specialized sigma24 family protein
MGLQPDYNLLLQQIRHGDSDARERLFAQLEVRLRTILKYRLQGWPEEELDDVLQDTLLVVSEKLEQVESNPDHYALNVLRNKIGNRIVRRRRREYLSLDPTGSPERGDEDGGNTTMVLADPESDFSAAPDHDTANRIRRAVGRLSPLCQALFTALLENLSVAETWEFFGRAETGLQRSTFDKRLFDCRRKLRQLVA